MWGLFEVSAPVTDVFLKNDEMYLDKIKQQCPHIYCLHQLDIYLFDYIVVRDELGAVGCQKADTLAFLNGRVYL